MSATMQAEYNNLIHQAVLRLMRQAEPSLDFTDAEDPTSTQEMNAEKLACENYQSFIQDIPQLSARTSQCFPCSRIFYGQALERCPRCGSSSISVYAADDLRIFERRSDIPALVAKPKTAHASE